MSYATFNGRNIIPMPAHPVAREITLDMYDTVGFEASPFTQQSQVVQWPMGDFWTGNISLPPQQRASAQPWLAFLASCRGKANVFQVGDVLGASPTGVGGNQVLNGGFELSTGNSSTTGDSWSVFQSSSVAASIYSTGYFHSGGACQLIRWLPSSVLAGGEANSVSSTPFAVTGGQSISFGGWRSTLSQVALPSGVSLLMRIGLRFLSSSGGTVSEVDIDATFAGNGSTIMSTAWNYVSQTTTVPSGAVTAILLLCAYNVSTGGSHTLSSAGLSADMYFDDVFAAFDVPVLSGAQNAGATYINTRGWRLNGAGLLNQFDYLQIGYRLHAVAGTTAVNSDGSGNATFEIWPSLRESQADGVPLVLNNATGLFMLADNKRSWTVDYEKLYPIAFKIMEAR